MLNPSPIAAIDFGISNTDIVAQINGETRRWTEPYTGYPDPDQVRAILAKGGVDLAALRKLAVTGGRHRLLPAQIGDCVVQSVGELEAIGRGGQAIAAPFDEAQPLLVVSAGSGTAMIKAQGRSYGHFTGTAVGGGTMLGLSQLLIGTVDPQEIDQLAQSGNSNGVDLSLADVITGPIGSLPAEATAVNFGRMARSTATPNRADLAAGIITLVGQTIALIAINAARALPTNQIVITGHLTDMVTIRRMLTAVSALYGQTFQMPADAGYATALGALLTVQDQTTP
ncbi:MAG: Fumble domain-containing protein [Caldilinea sp. CFX5]|nr:Fumble domain-containing protein [Caldilinea sp. CFX5]